MNQVHLRWPAVMLVVFGMVAMDVQPPTTAMASVATLYVATTGSDSNPGTDTQPLRTIAHAATLASAGTTVYVAPGTYTDSIVSSNNGTAGARIRFVSTSRWGALIRTSGAYRAWLNYGNYVDIVGFDISATDAHLGIQNEGSYAGIQGNHVHDVASYIDATTCDSNGGAGIVDSNYSGGYNEVSGNVVHDIGNPSYPIVPTSCWGVHGIYESNYGGHIFNNISYHNEAFGIHLWHASNATTVSSNLSFNNGVGGMQVGAGDSPGGVTANNYVISNNIIMDNPQFGIRGAGSMGSNNLYLNNDLYRNGAQFTNISTGISGTLNVDPQFVNYQLGGLAAGGDYHLKSTSPAINAGVSLGAPATDYDGVARPQGLGFDIGPYEFVPTATALTQTWTIFSSNSTPGVQAAGAGIAAELGVKFRASTNGYVQGIRFYKSSSNTGTHTGSLWTAKAQLLAHATFTTETPSGWQQVTFPAPVQIGPGTTYIASYHTDAGNYALDESFFGSSSVTNGPLTALQSGTDGPNGVYKYGGTGFPSKSWHSSNYWVDVVFSS